MYRETKIRDWERGGGARYRAWHAARKSLTRTPNTTSGAHATSRSATCCVPRGTGWARRAAMSIRGETVARIWETAARNAKRRTRHTCLRALGIGGSVSPASYVETGEGRQNASTTLRHTEQNRTERAGEEKEGVQGVRRQSGTHHSREKAAAPRPRRRGPARAGAQTRAQT